MLPADSVRITDHGNETAIVSCSAVPAMSYRLESSTDLKKWGTVARVRAGLEGLCQHLVAISDTTFYHYAHEPLAP